MKLAIVGYGKMGRLIEQLAPEYGFTVHAQIDVDGDFAQADGADAAIEFTVPHAVPGNVEKLAALGIPVVVGTTGWLPHMNHVRAAIEKNGAALVWSPNFSIGVNVFSRAGARSRPLAGRRAAIRRLGLGNSSPHQERRALGNAASSW